MARRPPSADTGPQPVAAPDARPGPRACIRTATEVCGRAKCARAAEKLLKILPTCRQFGYNLEVLTDHPKLLRHNAIETPSQCHINGRLARLKIRSSQEGVGSSLTFGTGRNGLDRNGLRHAPAICPKWRLPDGIAPLQATNPV